MFWKKKRRIEELEEELKSANNYIKLYNKEKTEKETLMLKIKGERVAGMHCDKCIHVINNNGWYDCELNCKCKDYERDRTLKR